MSKSTNASGETRVSPDELAIFRALKPYIGHCLTMNHELNNSLAGIFGYAEFLLEEADQLTDEHRNYLRQILKCAQRIQTQVEDLCEQKLSLNEKIDLRSVVEAYEDERHSD